MKDLKHRIVFGLSSVSVFIDHLLRAFWLFLCLVMVFMALAFFGVTDVLSDKLFQIFAFAAFAFGIWSGVKRFTRPTVPEIEHRLYQANRIPVNPFRQLKDRPADDLNESQKTLWESGQNYAQHLKDKLHPALPAPKLGREDRYGLRYIAVSLLLLGWLYQGSGHGAELARAFIPEKPGFITARSEVTELWITPPEYTGLAPIYLDQSSEDIMIVPEDSHLTARVGQTWMTPRLITTTSRSSFISGESGGFTIEHPLEINDQTIRIKTGLRTRLRADIIIDIDDQPIASIADGPHRTENNRIALRYAAQDDYGLESVEIQIAPDRMIARRLGNPPPFIRRQEMGGQKFIDQTVQIDLTDHFLAGLPVEVTVVATDTRGQVTKTPATGFVLPEITFSHPVARQLAALRQDLLWSADTDSYRLLSNTISSILTRPDSFKNDTGVYLGLSSAMFRLRYITDISGTAIGEMRNLLWQLALRIEGGSTRVAAENLQNTLSEMAQALENPNLSEEEFSQLQEQLETAMNEYFQSLMRELAATMQEQGQDLSIPQELNDRVQNRMDTGDFMNELMEALQSGSRSEVADALREMERMVEQMKNARLQPMTESMRKTVEELTKLKEVIRDQEALLDQTHTIAPEISRETHDYGESPDEDSRSIFDNEEDMLPPSPSETNRGTQPPAPPPSETVETGHLGDQQQAIREILRDIQTALEQETGQSADFIDRADSAMKTARDAFVHNAPNASIPHQERALQELKQGMDQAMEQMASGLGSMISLGLPSMGARPGGDTDPLGRRMGRGRNTATDNIDIPEEEKRRRIRKIRDRILERSGDFDQDPLSDEYFDNLLERF